MMDWFYKDNIVAVFLGDGKESRKRAHTLFFDFNICSVFFDDKISFLTRLSPFIRSFSTRNFSYDDTLLSFIGEKSESNGKLALLFVGSNKFKNIVTRNEEYISSRFITDTDEVIKKLQEN